MKRSILLPVVLLVYLAVMAYFTYPAENSELSYTQYWITIGVTLFIIVLLAYFLKKKEKNKKK